MAFDAACGRDSWNSYDTQSFRSTEIVLAGHPSVGGSPSCVFVAPEDEIPTL
jgi:hypothetical protein